MDLLKYMAPKKLMSRWGTSPSAAAGQKDTGAPRAALPKVREPIENIVDRYQANLPSIHKLICLNRQLLEHRQAEMADAEAQRLGAVQNFRYRALGAMPLCTLAFEIDQLSQAGLASAHATGAVIAFGAAAALLACRSVAALGTATRAQRRRAVLSVRQDELQGAIERETRAATRTLSALDELRRAARPIDHDVTQVMSGKKLNGQPPHARPQAFSELLTPPPKRPSQAFARPAPMPLSHDSSAGTTFRQPQFYGR